MGEAAETREPLTIPDHLTQREVERVAREATVVYHDLKEQTFGTTTWLQVPLVKTPGDILSFQQIIAETRPQLIVETGVYVGGSALLFASIQQLMGIEDAKVIAVDIDLSFVHERVRSHPGIELIEGSSLDPQIVARIRSAAEGRRVMVDLDSDHRGHHVLEELQTFSSLVTPGCYLVVEDCFMGGRPVRPDAVPGPTEALEAWLAEDPPFEPDRWRERFLITQNPRGYLRRTDGEPPRRMLPPENFMIGSLELSAEGAGAPVGGAAATVEELAAEAGEPDAEVEALRRSLVEGPQAERRSAEDLARRRSDVTVDNLLREMQTLRTVLRERDRMLARERAQLRRITSSLPYRFYQRLRGLPGVRGVAARSSRR
jgi:cephalosporin hydroxylase